MSHQIIYADIPLWYTLTLYLHIMGMDILGVNIIIKLTLFHYVHLLTRGTPSVVCVLFVIKSC